MLELELIPFSRRAFVCLETLQTNRDFSFLIDVILKSSSRFMFQKLSKTVLIPDGVLITNA